MNAPISFEQDSKLVNQLLAVLSREQTNLVMADIDAIESLLEEKSVLLQQMNLTAKARYEALAVGGFEASELGMGVWLKQQSKPAVNDAWADFQKALSQAKEMNRLNGMLINKHFTRNQQMLNHLQGNSSAGGVYGRDGQAKPQANSRAALTA
ncbi:MAG TPA: flagellar protein FlgN [Methylophilaceae bacterium]|nr:flagellar protein FlgN [Methylophilaceae bacterium]HSI28986.1 flagellar protein FlgN [Methylophilus sp.]